ncbi:hypothetical protein CMQ_2061 [Grosmannia clavigera kw1407]|uniref:Alpha-mannosyltransferase n=1 Tax=Grosmannia clavigera (strain kw1407 / UAMH 11150) TaxID=655863 RepID=F0XMW5_GROCL|nr:uncharacterized protein CMQ_2061 [Grosmannia clavigera kw1407]EFX00980.1 hypothetical protein CMQ_2061 [Grosmannia clavigera kw1407]
MMRSDHTRRFLDGTSAMLLHIYDRHRWRMVMPAGVSLILLWVLYASLATQPFAALLWLPQHAAASSSAKGLPAETTNALAVDTALLRDIVEYFADYPINHETASSFGEMGRRTRVLGDWLTRADELEAASADRMALDAAIEALATQQFSFLARPPRHPDTPTPLADLRATFAEGTTGIVVAAGDGTARFAGHLVAMLRDVLNSTLPIQIAYAGDDDLSLYHRARLAKVFGETSKEASSPPPAFLDVTSVFDEATLRFDVASGGWAVKAFAALAAPFETVIVIDADAVFLQPPEALLDAPGFRATGTLLFRDRLLWQHAFADRHTWWHDQIRRPSSAMSASRTWTEEYAEEGDSGVVVLDKGRPAVLAGLLHTAWQNTHAVREHTTYRITYGDKESWWLGLELAGAPYAVEAHYGAIVGWDESTDGTVNTRVCSFVIAHVDATDCLLWYNGSLLKNKAVNSTEYALPDSWMIDGTWQKGATKQDSSCMVGAPVKTLTIEETARLRSACHAAAIVDDSFRPF